jgi:hypothetical protein
MALAEQIPEGWAFLSADGSIVGSCYLQYWQGKGYFSVVLRRDIEGQKWWHSLDDEGKETVALHVSGQGLTFEIALQNAIAEAERATPTPPKELIEKIR